MTASFSQFILALLAFCATPFLLVGQTAGVPDPTFGQDGEVFMADSISSYNSGAIVTLPDGKLVIVGLGYYDPITDTQVPVLIRLLQDGSVDPSYAIDGYAHPNLGLQKGYINRLALTADGKIVVATYIRTDSSWLALAARLDVNGTLDSTFGQGGKVIFDFGEYENYFTTLLIKPDGKILLGGNKSIYTAGNGTDFILVQLLPNGTPDSTFGVFGVATANFAQVESVYSLALQDDGKIVTAGEDDFGMKITRFYPDGSIDSSFANGGAFTFAPPTTYVTAAYAVAIQDDQKIVFCGYNPNLSPNKCVLVRLLPNGSLDTTFGTNGQVYTNLGPSSVARSVIIQPDGKILVSAETNQLFVNPTHHEGYFWVVRYRSDGSLDPTFGNGGKVSSPYYQHPYQSVGFLLQPDGKIVQTGTVNGKIVVLRYLNDFTTATAEPSNNDFHLQCSPNPVAESTKLSWTLKESAEVRCDLYNAQGQRLQNLVPAAFLPAGVQQQTIHFTNEIPVGAYFLVLRVGQQQQVISLIK